MNQNSSVEEETKRSRYILGFVLLAGVSLIFGSGFPVMKEVVSSVSPQLLTTSRYVIAALILSPLLSNLNKSLIRDGAIIGLIFFSTSVLECLALENLSASRAGFTFALSVIFVTLFEIIRGKSLSVVGIIAATMAFAGIALMSSHSGEPLIGNLWIIVAALLDSAYIIVIEKSVTVHPPLKLAAVSCWIPAICGLIWSAPSLGNGWMACADNIWGLLYLGVVGIALATVMETTGQQWVPGNEVAIFRTLEPLSAALLSFWFLGETFNSYDYLGSGMVLSAIILLLFFKRREFVGSQERENVPNTDSPLLLEKEADPNPQP